MLKIAQSIGNYSLHYGFSGQNPFKQEKAINL